jgi:kumamolisin
MAKAVAARKKTALRTSESGARAKLGGAAHIPLAGERRTGRTSADAELEVTLVLRRRSPLPELHGKTVSKARHLTRDEMGRKHGARADDLAAVKRFARQHGLVVSEAAGPRRTVVLSGKAAEVERAFGVKLMELEHARGKYRAAQGRVSVPKELGGVVKSVLGLSTRPCARRRRIGHPDTVKPFWTVQQMARAYGFPVKLNAAGQTIGLIELGGGYHEEDLRKFFARMHRPMPKIRCVALGGAKNAPAPAEQVKLFLDVVKGKRKMTEVPEDVLAAAQSTLEVTMDIEMAAALAPGAEIVVYMAPNTEQGIYHAVSRAIRGEKQLPCALSISWGEPETGVRDEYLSSVDEMLRDAAMLGVTVCVSSGDEGAMNGATDGNPVVNFPASSPHVLSCGGSTVHWARGESLREAAWNCVLHGMHGATGGGVSRKFGAPTWQKARGVPLGPTGRKGRGVPDVAGPADPHHGCAIVAGGECCGSAGTSAVAPLWAALVACVNSTLKTRCGYITPLLYEITAGDGDRPLREITEGNNGFYEAGPGWNACTGLGSPMVARLMEALRER